MNPSKIFNTFDYSIKDSYLTTEKKERLAIFTNERVLYLPNQCKSLFSST